MSENNNSKDANGTKSLLISITIGLCIAFVFNSFFTVVTVNGHSMDDTLKNGQRVVIRKNSELKKGDIVVCKPNGNKHLIKRIIASEGDTIDIDFEKHTVTVNGNILDEPYIKEPTANDEGAFTYPVVVPDDCYFLMGDNRNHSTDSRDASVGFVNQDEILGKVIFK